MVDPRPTRLAAARAEQGEGDHAENRRGGNVTTHASSISRTVRQRTLCAPAAMIAPDDTCVVDIGKPPNAPAPTRIAVTRFAKNPLRR
jgi:hypothetical protein